MHLLTPLALLWLVPTVTLVVVLYLLRLRRRPVRVSSVMLWFALVRDLQANVPFQRLRRNLLLFVQLMVLIALGFALARPYQLISGLSRQSVVAVMDISASMQANDVAGTRFGQAQRHALRLASGLARGESMMVIAAGGRTRAVTSFTSDRRVLARAIRGLEAQDAPARLDDAMKLALAAAHNRRRCRVVVISDGGFEPMSGLPGTSAAVDFIRVGRRCDNVGIVALDARRTLAGAAGYQVFVAIQNFSDRPRQFDLELSLDDRLIDVRPQRLGAHARRAETFTIAAKGGRLTARLRVRDDLPLDDTANLLLARRRKASVLLMTPGNLFLEQALAVDPSVAAVKGNDLSALKAGAKHDMVIVDRVVGRLPANNNYLLIAAGGDRAPAIVRGSAARPTIIDWRRDHPVTRFVDFSGVQIMETAIARPRQWGDVLVESSASPVVIAGTQARSRVVYLTWDLCASDFPLRVGFPIFIGNCIDWLTGRTETAAQWQARTGGTAWLNLPAAVREVEITDPRGVRTRLPITANPLPFTATERAGVYRVKAGKFSGALAVNLLDEKESDLRLRDQIVMGEGRVARASGRVRANREWWRLLAAIVLVGLCAEWYLYHRRP